MVTRPGQSSPTRQFPTHLGRHEGESIDAAEETHADANDEHDAGQGEDRRQQGDQPEMRPARRGHGEGELKRCNTRKGELLTRWYLREPKPLNLRIRIGLCRVARAGAKSPAP